MLQLTTPVTSIPLHPRHPKGSKATVLLTSVFGPYAQDDAFGSRAINPMELYHNQVTRVQGAFSLRMHHRSWGIMLIGANIAAPCRILDFPTLDRFTREITENHYDVIGISSIIPNVGKVAHMCELILLHCPKATILVGGHVANMPDLNDLVDADHIVRGEGVAWMRRFLGEDPAQPIRHPHILSGFNAKAMGVKVGDGPGDTAATLIPSVGCPMGCNFCSTSAMFGGKGKFNNFYDAGDELFEIMCGLEREMGVNSFFIMDENFLFHRKRALRLLDLMREHQKDWSMYVFTSANVLQSYTMDQIVGLGVSWIWMGLEGKDSRYSKLKNIDTLTLVRKLQAHGICVLGSTIIGLEDHTPENIDAYIDHAVAHDTEFHQFMLYTPLPGTPLHAHHKADGSLHPRSVSAEADIHGQDRFNFRHPHIHDGKENEFLLRAFRRDFEVNGPSVLRMARTLLQGWRQYKNHPESRIVKRFRRAAADLPTTYAAGLWAARKWFADNHNLANRLTTTLRDIQREFGLKAKLIAPLAGRYVMSKLKRETKQLAAGHTHEPHTFYEANEAAIGLTPGHGIAAQLLKWISPQPVMV